MQRVDRRRPIASHAPKWRSTFHPSSGMASCQWRRNARFLRNVPTSAVKDHGIVCARTHSATTAIAPTRSRAPAALSCVRVARAGSMARANVGSNSARAAPSAAPAELVAQSIADETRSVWQDCVASRARENRDTSATLASSKPMRTTPPARLCAGRDRAQPSERDVRHDVGQDVDARDVVAATRARRRHTPTRRRRQATGRR